MTLVDILLKKCMEKFDECLLAAKNCMDDYGNPPAWMIIRYKAYEQREQKAFIKGWDYFPHKPLQVRTTYDEPDNPVSGMYYEHATADFYYDETTETAYIDLIYGPRYGRGYSYQIRENQSGIGLENEQQEWVS